MSKIETYLGLSIIGFFLIGMLAGCSERPTHSSDTDLSAATAEQNSPQDNVNTRKVDLSFLSKPKRPIQTPWGTKDVYDPTQDPDVRAAYRNYMESGFADEKRKLLFKARKDGREYYKFLGCSLVIDGACDVHEFYGCEGLEPYEPCNAINWPPYGPFEKCLVNNKTHHILGFKTTSDFEESISMFFTFGCDEWKE